LVSSWRTQVGGWAILRRSTSPVGGTFVLFVVAVLALYVWAVVDAPTADQGGDGLAAEFGVVAATITGVAVLAIGYRVATLRTWWLAPLPVVLLGVGTVWQWAVFVGGSPAPMAAAAVGVISAGSAVVLLLGGLRLAQWMEAFSGLGLVALALAATIVQSNPATVSGSAALALLATAGGMACLYGTLVDLEVAEQRSMVELLDSKRHIEEEMARAEEILHDLRSGLLAIEAAIGSFDGELAAPIRAEAARLRRLTVRGQRAIGAFDLVETVRNLVSTRVAGGVIVDLRAPASAQVWGEASEITAIVENLLSNAERHGRSSPIVVEITEEAGRTVLAVSDDGPGIGADDLAVIWERGATSHPDGDGIGLSRARMLASMNRAELVYQPSPDGRTTFTLDLRRDPPVAV
jgi:signal transduction histidine kinase